MKLKDIYLEIKSQDKYILNLVRKLKQIDDVEGISSKKSLPIVKKLQHLKVMDDNGNYIYNHPLMDEIDNILG